MPLTSSAAALKYTTPSITQTQTDETQVYLNTAQQKFACLRQRRGRRMKLPEACGGQLLWETARPALRPMSPKKPMIPPSKNALRRFRMVESITQRVKSGTRISPQKPANTPSTKYKITCPTDSDTPSVDDSGVRDWSLFCGIPSNVCGSSTIDRFFFLRSPPFLASGYMYVSTRAHNKLICVSPFLFFYPLPPALRSHSTIRSAHIKQKRYFLHLSLLLVEKRT